MKVKQHYRSFDSKAWQLDESNRTIHLSFSSETPYERVISGEVLNEILDHKPESVDLGRLKSEGAVLRNHDPDQLIGKIEQVKIAGGVGRASVMLGSTDKANEAWSLISDGILRGVSVGYTVHEAIREQNDTLRVTKWVPHEISLVSNAADLSVGIGRSQDTENELVIIESPKMTEQTELNTNERAQLKAYKDEEKRVKGISVIGKRQPHLRDLADKFIANGGSVMEFNEECVRRMTNEPTHTMTHLPSDIFNNSESATYSRSRTALLNHDLDTFVRSKGQTRAHSIAGGATAGANAVIPYHHSELENLMRDISPIRDLVDVITVEGVDSFEEVISSDIAGSSWVGETAARPETANAALNKITTNLKEIYSSQTLTQRLLDQSHLDLSRWLLERISASIAELESDGFVNGTGTGDEPAGLLSYTMATTDDNSRAFGTLQYTASGAAAALSDPDALIELLYKLKPGYRSHSTWLMNSNTARVIMQLKDGQGNYLWAHGDVANNRPNSLLGRPVVMLEDLPDIAADAFPVWIGDWKAAIRFINGGALNITPDPYSNKPNVDFYSYFYTGFGVRDSQALKALKIEA